MENITKELENLSTITRKTFREIRKLSYTNFYRNQVQFLHVSVRFQNLENGRKNKMDIHRLLLVLIIKKKFRQILLKLNFFFIFQTKSSLSTSAFIFSTIFQILKTKFHLLRRQTWRNLKSIKFANLPSIKFM